MAVNLADLLPAVTTVTIGGAQVEVFGLDLEDLGIIIAKYEEPLKELFDGIEKPGKEINFAAIATQWPALVLDVITAGIKAQGQEEQAKRIPLSAKLEILQKVWGLTVDDPKKLTAILKDFGATASSLRKQIEA